MIAEIFKAKAVIVGSPTLNHGLLPTIMPILEDLRGLRFQNKIGAAFGTYGWSGESRGHHRGAPEEMQDSVRLPRCQGQMAAEAA